MLLCEGYCVAVRFSKDLHGRFTKCIRSDFRYGSRNIYLRSSRYIRKGLGFNGRQRSGQCQINFHCLTVVNDNCRNKGIIAITKNNGFPLFR